MLNAGLIVRKASTFRRLSPADRKLAFAAIALLAAVRIAVWLLPYQRVMRLVKNSSMRRSVHGKCTPREVAWAVRLASRYVPGATCLPQALTTYILLGRYGNPSCLRIGVAAAPKFEAHAWVECEGNVVIGGWESLDQFTSILTLKTGNPNG
jgi:hypothetical protein